METRDKNASLVSVQGWITLGMAKELFQRAGLDYQAEKQAANRPGFKAVAMAGETLSAQLVSHIEHRVSRNVVGVIQGTAQPNDYVLYTAHWDHLGVKPGPAGTDTIYNGAVDNAMGVASILEIAEAMAHAPPKRSVAFLAWTMEEQGLLGSQYFAEHPVWPLNHIVGGINIDANLPEGPAREYGAGRQWRFRVGNPACRCTEGARSGDLARSPNLKKANSYRSDQISLAAKVWRADALSQRRL